MVVVDRFARIDEYFAQNLRHFREVAEISQEDLAARMTELGFGFSQATVWKIEQNKRPVRVGEAAALHYALGIPPGQDLSSDPESFKHGVNLDVLAQYALDAYEELKAAARNYRTTQMEMAVAVHQAAEGGWRIPQARTAWLETSAVQVVLEAQIEDEHEDDQAMRVNEDLHAILDSMREHGYDPHFDPARLVIERPGQQDI